VTIWEERAWTVILTIGLLVAIGGPFLIFAWICWELGRRSGIL
jgi:hypothetical protein